MTIFVCVVNVPGCEWKGKIETYWGLRVGYDSLNMSYSSLWHCYEKALIGAVG
jgi:hypothetical protein